MTEAELINYKIIGLVIFMSIFIYAAFYAYRPKNKRMHEETAKAAIED